MKKLKCLLVLVLSILCICLTGCSSKDTETCKSVVENFLTSYQTLDGSAGKYLANRTDDIQFTGIQALLAEKMTFSIENVKKEDEKYLVCAQISTADFKKIFESVALSIDETTSQDEVLEKFYDAIDSNSTQIKTFSVEIPVQKYGEDYKIELTPELSNALFGGFNEYLSELTGGMLYEQT